MYNDVIVYSLLTDTSQRLHYDITYDIIHSHRLHYAVILTSYPTPYVHDVASLVEYKYCSRIASQ